MYEKTVSEISKSLRAMSKRVRHAEAQLSRRRGITYGTSEERNANESTRLWWDTDLNAFMTNFGDGWEPVKDVRTGTTAQRAAYTGVNTGEFWWTTDEERLYAWDGHAWESTDSAECGTTAEREASSPIGGQWWLDTDDDGLVYIYDGAKWKAPVSQRYTEPFLLLAELFGLFSFRPIRSHATNPLLLRNLTDGVATCQATQYNSPTFGDNGRTPYINLNASFSQYCTTQNYRATGDLTILAWVSPDVASGIMPIVDKWYLDTNDRCYRIILWNDNTFRFWVSGNGTTVSTYVSTSVIQNSELLGWNFIVGRFTAGSAIEIYRNGDWKSLKSGFSVTIPPSIHDYDDDIAFGKSNAASPVYFDGQMSVVAICKHAISDELIEYVYESTKSLYIPQPEPQLSDNVYVGEYSCASVSIIPDLFIDVSDSISVDESIDSYVTNVDVSDSVFVSENVEVGGIEFFISVSESISVVDTALVECVTGSIVSDSVVVAENVDVSLSAPEINVSDNISLTENIALDSEPKNITVSDSIVVTENVDKYYPQDGVLAMSVSDGTSVSEDAVINIENDYLLTYNYFSANYWPRIYPYWAKAP